MEPSKFNFRQSIENYINLIKSQGTVTNSDASELIDHMLDATAELKNHGLSEEEAFIIAKKRLGSEDILSEEYRKVNPSMNTNKIWAYLFIGYNLLYSVPSILLTWIGGIYVAVYTQFKSGPLSILILTCFHISIIIMVWHLVKRKASIAKFVEHHVRINPLRTVIVSFVPKLLFLVANIIFHLQYRLLQASAIEYPMRKFSGTMIEFTFYFAAWSIFVGVLGLIFSINNIKQMNIRQMFEKPSITFLIVLGIMIELLAASSRTIPGLNLSLHAFVFGLFYLMGSFLISYYNNVGKLGRQILLFSFLGITMEIFGGIQADFDRGNTYNTIYFSLGLFLGLLIGWWLGVKAREKRLLNSADSLHNIA